MLDCQHVYHHRHLLWRWVLWSHPLFWACVRARGRQYIFRAFLKSLPLGGPVEDPRGLMNCVPVHALFVYSFLKISKRNLTLLVSILLTTSLHLTGIAACQSAKSPHSVSLCVCVCVSVSASAFSFCFTKVSAHCKAIQYCLLLWSRLLFFFCFFLPSSSSPFLWGGGGGGVLVISYRANLANDNSQSWLTETSGRDPTMPSSYCCCPGRSVNTGRQCLGCPVVMKEIETSLVCESIWPNGKGLGWWAEGPRFESVSALLSLQNLWALDTVLWLCPSQLMKH